MQRKYINCYKNLAFGGKLMYKFERYRQLGPANFNQPVGFKMDPENRWVKKSETSQVQICVYIHLPAMLVRLCSLYLQEI